MAQKVHLWVRGETKANEHRALSPKVCGQLVENGFEITVERSTERIFDDEEYAKVGAHLVEFGTWRDAPASAYIVGLKELPEGDESPLRHTHIFFAHCFKRQAGWKDLLLRFKEGNGTLLDLEFLNDDRGRRVAAFGYHAGFAGSALGVDVWIHRNLSGGAELEYPAVKPYPNETELINHIGRRLKEAVAVAGRFPKVMVMGALGRCGSGACDFASRVGIPSENIIRWDMAETKAGGPFHEILKADIFINCIYLSSPIPPFLTKDLLENRADRQAQPLSVIVDVSCDTSNPHNPLPFYNVNTTFDKPLLSVVGADQSKLAEVIAIDHLPTLLPRESSEQFSQDLFQTLLQLRERSAARVWGDAEKLFREKLSLAIAESQ